MLKGKMVSCVIISLVIISLLCVGIFMYKYKKIPEDNKCLEKLIYGYTDFQWKIPEYLNIILIILKLTNVELMAEDRVKLEQLIEKSKNTVKANLEEYMVHISKLKVIWMGHQNQIINNIKRFDYENLPIQIKQFATILKDNDRPETIYNYLNEFLSLCIPRKAKDILEDAFDNMSSIIEKSMFEVLAHQLANPHLCLCLPDKTSDKLLINPDGSTSQLPTLYLDNLRIQLIIFIQAINLTNLTNINNNPIGIYWDTLITNVIYITLELRLQKNQDTLNKLNITIDPLLSQKVIQIIERYTTFYSLPIYDINNNDINTDTLISLINNTYTDNLLIKPEEEQIRVKLKH